MFDEACGSCMAVHQSILVTPLRMPHLNDGKKDRDQYLEDLEQLVHQTLMTLATFRGDI